MERPVRDVVPFSELPTHVREGGAFHEAELTMKRFARRMRIRYARKKRFEILITKHPNQSSVERATYPAPMEVRIDVDRSFGGPRIRFTRVMRRCFRERNHAFFVRADDPGISRLRGFPEGLPMLFRFRNPRKVRSGVGGCPCNDLGDPRNVIAFGSAKIRHFVFVPAVCFERVSSREKI